VAGAPKTTGTVMNGGLRSSVHVVVKGRVATREDPIIPASFEGFFETQRDALFRALYVLTRDREEASPARSMCFERKGCSSTGSLD
jgi:hypothetical protein